MSKDESKEHLWRGMVCLSLAIGFEEDRVRLGLEAAVNRLRDGLKYNGLWLDGDDQLLGSTLNNEISRERLAQMLCSIRRMGLVDGKTH